MQMKPNPKVLIRDWNLACNIGAYDAEREEKQNVRIDMDVLLGEGFDPDKLEDTFDPELMFCYATYIKSVEETLETVGHIDLLETLVPLLAEIAFRHKLVEGVRINAFKTDIMQQADVGVEMEFSR